MSTMNLLVELFVEELPPKALKSLGEAFSATLFESLSKQGLTSAESSVTTFASPRRLASHVTHVAIQAEDKRLSQKLMPVSVGLDADGQPTAALLKKLASLGCGAESTNNLTRASDGKTDALFLRVLVPGMGILGGLKNALDMALANLPIPKVMSYQLADGWSSVNFVRPVHGLVALHGADVVPVSVLGLQASRVTRGHRFEAIVDNISIRDADSYEQQLGSEGAVIASFEKRRAEIVHQLQEAAAKEGLKPIEDAALLDEVTALVERPNVLPGRFEETFLEVPQECLILTMKANQKYFPLLDGQGKLTNKFLLVSNIRPADPSAVIAGNERVVRPRLADAKFFFDQDRKKTLESRVLGLAKVVYHNKLGTQGDRVQRICSIAKTIGQQLGDDSLALQAEQAALLAKADLLTDMVGEFPELQGIMGRYYAKHDGISDEIAYAIEDHYKPRFAGDELPRNLVGVCVALADKLETLLGMFGIGQIPTGDKDPFALRRHAIGVTRILIEKEINLSVDELVLKSFDLMPSVTIALGPNANGTYHLEKETPLAVLNFVYERLSGYLRDQNYTSQEIDAVLSLRPARLSEIPKRLEAVRSFAALPEAAALAAANKRIQNILKKTEAPQAAPDLALMQVRAERDLLAATNQLAPAVESLMQNGDYADALCALAKVRAQVDSFFDDVMVMVDEPLLRNNRLALLNQLAGLMNRVADISRLAA